MAKNKGLGRLHFHSFVERQYGYFLLLLVLLFVFFLLSYTSHEGLSWLFWSRLGLGVLLVLLFFFLMHRTRGYFQSLRLKQGEVEELQETVMQLREEIKKLTSEEKETRVEGKQDVRLRELSSRLVGNTPHILTDSFFGMVAQEWQLVQGLFYSYEVATKVYECRASYAYFNEGGAPRSFRVGETLSGQVALECKRLVLDDLPAEYRIVTSGLGSRAPRVLLIEPLGSRTEEVIKEDEERGEPRKVASALLECAFFVDIPEEELVLLERFIALYWSRLESLLESSLAQGVSDAPLWAEDKTEQGE